VAREDRHDEIRKISRDKGFKKVLSIVPGGERRQDSVRAGLDRINHDAKYVAVHDAARPLITPEQIETRVCAMPCSRRSRFGAASQRHLKMCGCDLLVVGSVDRRHCTHANATDFRAKIN